MTVQELQRHLGQCGSLAECDTFVNKHFTAIASLFYELDPEKLKKEKCAYQDAFLTVASGPAANTFQTNLPLPHGVTALLILFASVFERVHLHADIGQVADILRAGHLFNRIRAMYRFKDITDTTRDYRDRFTEIISLLQATWHATRARDRSQCEDLAIEFYATAILENRQAGHDVHREFCSLFTSPAHRAKFPILSGARIAAVLTLPPDRLTTEQEEAAIRTSEAFYDEAARLIPLPAARPKVSFNVPACQQHTGHCVDGLHDAKIALADKYPVAFSRTGLYIQQSLTARAYTPFTDVDQCMRYLRQYMPLHMPQIERAVLGSLRTHQFGRNHIRVLDIGSGPGTLFCVLSALHSRHPAEFRDYTFEYSPLDPSKPFIDFFSVIAQHVDKDGVMTGHAHNCRITDLKKKDLRSIDWFFVGNAITPLIAHAGTIDAAVEQLHTAVAASIVPDCLLTIAENTATADFTPFCETLVKTGAYEIALNDAQCDGQWLAHCNFYVTGSLRPTRPRLRMAICRTTGTGTRQ